MNRIDGSGRHHFGATRGRDWLGTLEIEADMSADIFEGQVRLYPDATGAAILTMTVDTPVFSGGITIVKFSITDADLESGDVPATTLGKDLTLYYDIQRTSGGLKTNFLYGKFIIYGQVTVS
jgi:hypothetical protein